MMMKLISIGIATAAVLAFSGACAVAQDVNTTTTTTTHEHPEPAPGVTVGVPGVVGVHVGGGPSVETGCTTKRSTTTDTDNGASTTVKRSDC
jgi:hypothetical protein